EIDSCVNDITDTLLEAAYSSLNTRSNKSPFIKNSWWNNELEFLKNQFHIIRNRHLRGDPSVPNTTFRSFRNKYIRAIRKAKRNSWRNFIEEIENDNPFGNLYKVLKAKLKPISQNLPIIDNCSYCLQNSK